MNYTQAQKVDKSFYAEQDDEDWYVFGDNSGFAYGEYMNESDAEKAAEEMNETFGKVPA